MRVPRKAICEFADMGENFICEVDREGWGGCRDSIVNEDGEVCLWANEVLEWQDIKPVYLKGRKNSK